MPWADTNFVVLSGRAVPYQQAEQPEITEYNGVPRVKLLLRVSASTRLENGVEKWSNRFFPISAWGSTARILANVKRGERIGIIGKLDAYRGKTGWKYEIIAREVITGAALRDQQQAEDAKPEAFVDDASEVPF